MPVQSKTFNYDDADLREVMKLKGKVADRKANRSILQGKQRPTQAAEVLPRLRNTRLGHLSID